MKSIDFDLVADIYDAYVTADADLGFYQKLARDCGGNCLELMCGTGRVSLPLLAQGVRLTCVDYSQSMLDVLDKKASAAGYAPRIVCQDVCTLELGDVYDLILIPFNSFSEVCGAHRQRSALHSVARHLRAGGTFVCTFHNPEVRKKTADGKLRPLGRFPLPEGKMLAVSSQNAFDPQTGLVSGTQRYEIYGPDGRLIEKRTIDIRFALVGKDAFAEMAQGAGLTVKAVYGDYAFSPFTQSSPFMNFMLGKRPGV